MQSSQQRKVRELNSHYIEQHETMLERKTISRRGLYRRLSALGLFIAIVLCFTFFTLQSQRSVLEDKQGKVQLLQDELAQLELAQRDLNDEIIKLNDLEYISEIARRDYYLSKPGETIFKITTSTSD